MIYMDNAATTMHKPQEVIDAVVSAMSSMGNAGRGASEAALSASRIIYDTREGLAKLFGAENARQIAFTSNSTESLNIAIKGILDPGDHVITTVLEHNSVLRPLYEMEKKGTSASPATALASNVLPVPGEPTNSAPLGRRAPISAYFWGLCRKSMISFKDSLASS